MWRSRLEASSTTDEPMDEPIDETSDRALICATSGGGDVKTLAVKTLAVKTLAAE